MKIIIIFMLWLHYLATAMWIGGMAFNILVLRPSMVAIDQNQRPVLGTTVLKRFIIFAWLSMAVLILRLLDFWVDIMDTGNHRACAAHQIPVGRRRS